MKRGGLESRSTTSPMNSSVFGCKNIEDSWGYFLGLTSPMTCSFAFEYVFFV